MSGGQHFLVVAPFDPDDDTDRFDVEHPDDCPRLVVDRGPDGEPVTVENCAVGFYIGEYGVTEYFCHIDDVDGDRGQEKVAPGRHEIEAWHEVHRHPEYTEYDAGVRLVPQDS